MGEFKLQCRGGAQRSDVKPVLRITEIRCIGQASKVRATPIHAKGIIRCAVLIVVGQPEVENVGHARRRREGLVDGIHTMAEERRKIARMDRDALSPDPGHDIWGPQAHRPTAYMSRFKSAIGNEVGLGGLSYAHPEQAHKCQDAVNNMFSRCHFAN